MLKIVHNSDYKIWWFTGRPYDQLKLRFDKIWTPTRLKVDNYAKIE